MPAPPAAPKIALIRKAETDRFIGSGQISYHFTPSLSLPTSKDGGSVFALEFAKLLFQDFEFDGELMERFVKLILGFLMVERTHGGVDLHELLHDDFAGIADLLDGFGTFHIFKGGGESRISRNTRMIRAAANMTHIQIP